MIGFFANRYLGNPLHRESRSILWQAVQAPLGVTFQPEGPPMPDKQPRASEKFRAFLDGEVSWSTITITEGPRDGILCTLGGKVVKVLKVV